jgi:hypothetical protein
MATGVYSRAHPGPLKVTISEAYLTQPMLMGAARWAGGRFFASGMLNAEGATLMRGEINPGVYGEGYVDRRHPHTWLHEAMIGVSQRLGATRRHRVALYAGKGFVPYGTDDPMVRPFVKFPVNHHHSQILERAMVGLTLESGRVTLEGASFNGDEPEGTTDLPNRDRLFDSWSVRGTWRPASVVEVSGSHARVASPEFAAGFGLDQKKDAASIRVRRASRRWSYALLEYARTREFSDDRLAFTFSTVLAEGTLERGGWLLSGRAERTTRPEEERLDSFFRTIRPLLDFSIVGRTRWTNVSLNVTAPGRGSPWLTGRPFVEIGYHVPRATLRPAIIDPVELFGGRQVWMVSAGVRLHAGTMRDRVGRYGVIKS